MKDSKFAREFGVELHEIIFFLWDLKNKSEFWDQIIGKEKDEITRSKQLFKLTYALVFATIKTKHNKVMQKAEMSEQREEIESLKKPSLDSMKELTRILKFKIKRGMI